MRQVGRAFASLFRWVLFGGAGGNRARFGFRNFRDDSLAGGANGVTDAPAFPVAFNRSGDPRRPLDGWQSEELLSDRHRQLATLNGRTQHGILEDAHALG